MAAGDTGGARRQPQESGIALVAVLWVMVVLAALAASFSTSTRTQVNLARNLVEAAKAEALADAGVARAGAGLVVPPEDGGLRSDGTVYEWRFAGGEARFSVSDEGGKVDINVASPTLLGALFSQLGVDRGEAETLADAIVAYRGGGANGDEQFEADGDGAGDTGEVGDSFNGTGATPFTLVEELQRVPGMTGAVFERIAPSLTVYSAQPDPDENAALPDVRAALAATRGQRGAQAVAPPLDKALPLPAEGPLSMIREGSLAARSMIGVFTVHCEGRSPGGGIFVREAVIGIEYGGGQPYSVRLWRQGRRRLYARPGEEWQ